MSVNPNIILRTAIDYLTRRYLLDKDYNDFVRKIKLPIYGPVLQYPTLTIFNPIDTMDLSVIYHDQLKYQLKIFNDQDEEPILDVLILTRRQLDKFLSKQDIDLILFNYNSFNSKELYRCQEGDQHCWKNSSLTRFAKLSKKYLKQKPWKRSRQPGSSGFKKQLLLDEYHALPPGALGSRSSIFPGGKNYLEHKQHFEKFLN